MPCVKVVSGSGGTSLIDGDTATCSLLPFRTYATPSHHYDLSIHRHCAQPEIAVLITVENSTACAELADTVFMEKLSGCNDANPYDVGCDLIREMQSAEGRRVCEMRCKCADSADQCMIHILSGITPKDIDICEIKADGSVELVNHQL